MAINPLFYPEGFSTPDAAIALDLNPEESQAKNYFLIDRYLDRLKFYAEHGSVEEHNTPAYVTASNRTELATIGYITDGSRSDKLDFATEILTYLGQNLTDPRQWCALVGSRDRFYAVGGSKVNRTLQNGTVDRYSVAENITVRMGFALEESKDMAAGATAGNSGYLFGGDVWHKGTVNITSRIDYVRETIETLSAVLPTPQAVCSSAAGNREKIWLFGGGERTIDKPTINLFDHVPSRSITEFNVADSTIVAIGGSLDLDLAWRNAAAGNRHSIFIAGGVKRATNPRIAPQVQISTQKMQRFDIESELIYPLATQLSSPRDSMLPLGGSSSIYYAGGFSGSATATSQIEKLDTRELTMVAISTNLASPHAGSGGISDFSAGH